MIFALHVAQSEWDEAGSYGKDERLRLCVESDMPAGAPTSRKWVFWEAVCGGGLTLPGGGGRRKAPGALAKGRAREAVTASRGADIGRWGLGPAEEWMRYHVGELTD